MPMRANTPGTTPAKMEKPSNLISTVTSAPTASAMSRFSMEVCLTPPRRKRQSGDAVRSATRYRCRPRGPLSKLVDETDSKSVAAYPASRFESGEGHGTSQRCDGIRRMGKGEPTVLGDERWRSFGQTAANGSGALEANRRDSLRGVATRSGAASLFFGGSLRGRRGAAKAG